MAAKVDIGQEVTARKVDHRPPQAPRHGGGSECLKEFHNRSKLFGSSVKHLQSLCQNQSNGNEPQTDDILSGIVGNVCNGRQSSEYAGTQCSPTVTRPRRIQSAKGRLEKQQDMNSEKTYLEKSGSQVSIVDINLNIDIPVQKTNLKRPPSPSHFSHRQDVSIERSVSRPSSAKASIGRHMPASNDSVTPSVYGLRLKRQVFGSDPGIFASRDNIKNNGFPYVFSIEQPQSVQESKENFRAMPACLEPLRPWMNTDVSQDIIGVDPATCLVFLSAFSEDLPEVPPPQSATDVLPWRGDLPPAASVPNKKYRHPFFERKITSKPPKNICTEDGTVLHRRYDGMRTAEIIKKEIQDLENLLRGIGTYDSECMMVQYQADITRLREMVDDTLALVPDRIKNPQEPPDTFGLRKFLREHEQIIAEIQEHHQMCVLELADLEGRLDLTDDQLYFSKLPVHIPS